MRETEELKVLRRTRPDLFNLPAAEGCAAVAMAKHEAKLLYTEELRAMQQLQQSYRATLRWERQGRPGSGPADTE